MAGADIYFLTISEVDSLDGKDIVFSTTSLTDIKVDEIIFIALTVFIGKQIQSPSFRANP